MPYGDKYVLTGDTKEVDGHTLHRIEATRDFKPGRSRWSTVRKGDLGGWVERGGKKGEEDKDENGFFYLPNLRQEDDSWVGGNATVFERARVTQSAWVDEHAVVRGNGRAQGECYVGDKALVTDNGCVTDTAVVTYQAVIRENGGVRGRAQVTDNAVISGNASVGGTTYVTQDAKLIDGSFHVGRIGRFADVSRSNHVIVVTGLFEDMITMYRTSGKNGHRVAAGCQLFQLDDDIEEIAAQHDWELAPGWKSLRGTLRMVVKAWHQGE